LLKIKQLILKWLGLMELAELQKKIENLEKRIRVFERQKEQRRRMYRMGYSEERKKK
jgi:hypothetical protein